MQKSNWDKGDSGKRIEREEVVKHDVSLGKGGTYADMLKSRKANLAEIKQNIDKVLEDYDGGAITIVLMREDSNGLPTGHQLFMAGVARPEVQVDMGKALNNASKHALKMLHEAVRNDPVAARQLLKIITQAIGRELDA